MITEKCKGTCQSDVAMVVIEPKQPHSHQPSTEEEITLKQRKQQVVHKLKTQALANKDSTPATVATDVLGPCSKEELEILPLEATCRRYVSRERPTNPAPADIHFVVSLFIFFLCACILSYLSRLNH